MELQSKVHAPVSPEFPVAAGLERVGVDRDTEVRRVQEPRLPTMPASDPPERFNHGGSETGRFFEVSAWTASCRRRRITQLQ